MYRFSNWHAVGLTIYVNYSKTRPRFHHILNLPHFICRYIVMVARPTISFVFLYSRDEVYIFIIDLNYFRPKRINLLLKVVLNKLQLFPLLALNVKLVKFVVRTEKECLLHRAEETNGLYQHGNEPLVVFLAQLLETYSFLCFKVRENNKNWGWIL